MKKMMFTVLVLSVIFINSCGSDSKDGTSALMDLTAEEAGENCENGGIRVDSGMDLNSDGKLDEDEILVTEYICNGDDGTGTDGEDGKDGAKGSDGEDGTDGTNGDDGISCWDLNGNNECDLETEDINEDDACDALDCAGTNGEDGTNGTDGEDGTNGEDGACYGNTAPVIGSILINGVEYPDLTMIVELNEVFSVNINLTDADLDTIQYSLIGPSGITIADEGDGNFIISNVDIEEYSFTLIVSDGCQIVMKSFSFLVTLESKMLATGGQFSSFVSEGKAYSWGRNFDRELGAGITDSYKTVPVAVDDSGVLSGKDLVKVSAGNTHACVLDTDGMIYCWGAYYMGDGSGWSSNTSPVAVDMSGVLSGKTVVKLTTGWNDTCVLDKNGALFCWGYNNYGQLGDGSQDDQLTPVTSLTGISLTDVSLGWDHSCGIRTDGSLICWGNNDKGQLGDDNGGCTEWNNDIIPPKCAVPTLSTSAVEVVTDKKFVSVSSSKESTCALSTEGEVYCWGSNEYGRLGDGTTEDRLTPVKVEGLLNGKVVVALATGSSHACALDSENMIYCWGYNDAGQLGDASYDDSSTPVEVDMSGVLSGVTIKEISAGGYNTCVLSEANEVYCWGSGDIGRLGNNSTAKSNVPVKVNPLP